MGVVIAGAKNALLQFRNGEVKRLAQMNQALLDDNLLAADPYPERSPVGGAEKSLDTPRVKSVLKKVPLELTPAPK